MKLGTFFKHEQNVFFIVNNRLTLFLIDLCFKDCSNDLKFEKNAELFHPPVSQIHGSPLPSVPEHWELQCPGIQDTVSSNTWILGCLQLPGVPDTREL